MSFIDEDKIYLTLNKQREANKSSVSDIIEKSKKLKGLSLEDTAALLQTEDENLIAQMYSAAKEIKEEIYGNRLVMFAPLYISNLCVNNCAYCGFRVDNKEISRKHLDVTQITEETEAILKQGHKRILLVAGEHPDTSSIEYLSAAIKAAYSARDGQSMIRRINVNAAPMSVANFAELKKTGIGTFQLFQETYHHDTYKLMHQRGPKANYSWRLDAMDRAQEAGIDDIGIGALLGLYDYKFEVLAMLTHAKHLEQKFNTGPHTISVPRVKPAFNTPLAGKVPYPVSDEEFKKIVAIIRMAVPYTGMILSTRESKELRDEVFQLGISQISAGSHTNPGGYAHGQEEKDAGQFYVTDTRTQLEVIKDVIQKGFMPSFCTACYRVGRTGEDFMKFAKEGDIKEFCQPNSLLTLKEYLLDYADADLRGKGEQLIQSELEKITNKTIKENTIKKLKEIEDGRRDLYF